MTKTDQKDENHDSKFMYSICAYAKRLKNGETAFIPRGKLLSMVIILYCTAVGLGQEIAITIDDAPLRDTLLFTGKDRTQLLIDNLIRAGVPDALIFVVTQKVNEGTINQLMAYEAAGFHLANHSHKHLSANTEDLEVILEDIIQAHPIISSFDNFLPYYRPPYLHYGSSEESRDAIQDHLKTLGYKVGYVTVDNYEWYMDSLLQTAMVHGRDIDFDVLKDVYVETLWETIRFYDNIAKQTLGRSPKHVLLLHETDITALYIADLVAHIRAEGWTIISPQDAYTDPIVFMMPDVLFNEQGRVAAIARAQGWHHSRLRHESEDEGYLNDLFEKRGVFK